jgi:hypothetical protein
MKKKIIILIAAIVMSQSAFAALPPFAQSAREIDAILTSEQLGNLLGMAQPIEEIKRTEGGYIVVTTGREIIVEIVYKPAKMPGPVPFELKFHSPTTVQGVDSRQ